MNEEHDVKHLGRLRLTWEHAFAAIALSGPYRAEAASNDLRLAPHTLLSVLRSQLTAWTILAEPSDREQLIEAAHDCAQDLPVALEHDHASAPRSATHLDKQLNAMERAELYAEAKNRLFFGIGDTMAFLLASLVGDRFSPGLDNSTFTEVAFNASFEILAGHPTRENFVAWIDAEEDSHRTVRHIARGRQNGLGLLQYFGTEKRWSFWRSWCQSFLDGAPLDINLQRQVAMIKNRIWQAGPDAVAEEIEKILAKQNLEDRIKELEAELMRATVNRHGIGGNLPPTPLEDAPIAKELVIIWQPLEDIKGEIASDDPDPIVLQKGIELLVAALKKGFSWCLAKGDLIVETAIKWAIPAGGTGYFALNPEKLEAVIEAVKKLLVVL